MQAQGAGIFKKLKSIETKEETLLRDQFDPRQAATKGRLPLDARASGHADRPVQVGHHRPVA